MSTNYSFANSEFTGTSTPVALDNYFIPKAPFTQGNLFAWGWNVYGQLGDNTIMDKSSPVQSIDTGTNWYQVSATFGSTSSFGIKTNGTLWAWGAGGSGALGDGSVVDKSSPVQVGTATNWKKISGQIAIKTDGTLWVWGYDYAGTGISPNVPVSTPVQVGTATNWKDVTKGYNHRGGIKTDGTLWLWGRNLYGELGDGTFSNWNGGAGPGSSLTNSKSTPIQVGTDTTWKKVSAGFVHTAAIKNDGTLWIWGGLTGVGPYQSTPVQVVGGGTDWKQLSSGNYVTYAIKNDGTLWSVTNIASSPVQISSGGTNWKQVSAGYNSNAAIKSNGTLWTWALGNSSGQLGDGTTVNKLTPIQVGTDTNWKQVSTSGDHMLAIKVY
jgi:alpha-tubulin suppressor-like RCC1 family protein